MTHTLSAHVPAQTGITLLDIDRYALAEAERIEQTQDALIAAELRRFVDPGKLRERDICNAIARLVRLCRGDKVILERLPAEVSAMREREPFVSGLPGPFGAASAPAPSAPTPPGLDLLNLILVLALDEIDALEPACVNRFDGVERAAADPVAIEKRRVYAAIATLVEGIKADPALTRRCAAILAAGGGRRR